ncbi:MAG: hypothetical protein GXC78_06895 [Chitinophagaceae bacterium]|nr:hypothetical protein [Chitinophagaceae bacterium]
MKKSIRYLVLLFFFGLVSFASIAKPLPRVQACLLYFKTWNFLKYYHPELASGRKNADSIFMSTLPRVLENTSVRSFNVLIRNLLSAYTLPNTMIAPAADNGDLLVNNFDLGWYERSNILNRANRNSLKALFSKRYTDSVHYYLPAKNYFAELPNEPAYAIGKTDSVSLNYRLLALAKLQGAVDYLYPHKYLMEQSFEELLRQAIRTLIKTGDRLIYERTLLTLVASLQDTHSFSFFKQMVYRKSIFNNAFYPPFDYQVFADGILVTAIIIPDWCRNAGINKGDFIVGINGKPVSQRIHELAGLLSASNRPTLINRLSAYPDNLVWGMDDPYPVLQIKRGNENTNLKVSFVSSSDAAALKQLNEYLSIDRSDRSEDSGLILLPGDIVYFKISNVARLFGEVPDTLIDAHMDSLFSLVRKKRAVIFDMRGYPDWGGFVYTYLPRSFGTTPYQYAKYYEVNRQLLGTYRYKPLTEVYMNADLNVRNPPYNGKVAILVDPETLSQSEWNTMHIQYLFPKAQTIGEISAGADGDEKVLNLPGGYRVNFTGNAVFYPDGSPAQKTGVKINLPVTITPEGVSKGKDELLEKALEWVN